MCGAKTKAINHRIKQLTWPVKSVDMSELQLGLKEDRG